MVLPGERVVGMEEAFFLVFLILLVRITMRVIIMLVITM